MFECFKSGINFKELLCDLKMYIHCSAYRHIFSDPSGEALGENDNANFYFFRYNGCL